MMAPVCSQASSESLKSPEHSANVICPMDLICFTLASAQSDVNLHKFHAVTPLSLLLHVSGSKEQPLMLASVLIMFLTARIYTLWFLLQRQLSFLAVSAAKQL